MEKTEITQEWVLQEIARVAFADMSQFVEWTPDGIKIIDSAELTKDQLAAISEVSVEVTENGRIVCIKLHDKAKALELLLRLAGNVADPEAFTRWLENLMQQADPEEMERSV